MDMNRVLSGAGVILFLIACAAVSHTLAQSGDHRNDSASQAGLALADVPTTLVTLPLDSEGLTVDPDTGTLYAAEGPDASGECVVRSVTMSGAVWKVGGVPRPSGSCAPRGLEFHAGRLYISDQGTGANGWVFEMDPATGIATTFASGVAGANGIAFDSRGNLWITDGLRGLGRVYKRDATTGLVQEVLRVPPVANGTSYGGRLSVPTLSGIGRQIINVPFGTLAEVKVVANGIAVVERRDAGAHDAGEPQRDHATLFIADTARGAIWAARLDEHGNLAAGQIGCDATLQDDTLCEHALLLAHPWLEGADGIWADDREVLWVATNARQGIVRVDPRRRNVTEHFRNPVNAQLLRSSADTTEGNTHLLEYPSSPVIVPSTGRFHAGTLCVTSSDRPARDNWPGTVGEIGGPGQDKGKISCF
jgi:streptogramin lyase